jgi:hypothetical protein
MNSNKIINGAQALAGSDIPTYQQVQDLIQAVATASIGGIAASLVSIVDAGAFYTAIDVEGALQEIDALIPSVVDSTAGGTILYSDGAGGWQESLTTTVFNGATWFIDQAILADYHNSGAEYISIGPTGVGTTKALWTNGGPLEIRADGGTGDIGVVQSPFLLTQDSTLFIEEQSPFPGSRTGYGQLVVRDDAPCTLWYADDLGTEYPLSGEGISTQTVYKGSTTTRNTTITLTDDPDLVVTLEPGQYIVEGFLNWGQSGAGGGDGIQYRMNVNSGSVNNSYGSIVEADQVAAPDGQADLVVLDIGGSTRARNNTQTDLHRGHYKGSLIVASTAEIAFQWAQNTSNADNVSMAGGSHLVYRKMDL